MKRGLGLFHWKEDVDISRHRETLLALAAQLGASFNRIGFRAEGADKSRYRTIRNPASLRRVIMAAEPFRELFLYDNHCPDRRVIAACLEYYDRYNDYTAMTDAARFDNAAMISHIELFCTLNTPRYGFCYDCETGQFAESAVLGMAIIQMPREVLQHCDRWWNMQMYTSDHLEGYLLDVFQLNVLSPLHLSFPVAGTSFDKWVAKGSGRGELVKIKRDVHVWLVPPRARARLRRELAENEMISDDD